MSEEINKKGEFNPAILIYILIGLWMFLVIFNMVDIGISSIKAEKNCQNNGWDAVGHRGAIMEKDYVCYNYTKEQRDAVYKNSMEKEQ